MDSRFTVYKKKYADLVYIYLFVFMLNILIRILVNNYKNISVTIWSMLICVLSFSAIVVKVKFIDKANMQSIGFTYKNLVTKVLIGLFIAMCQFLIYLTILVFIFGLKPEIIVMGREKMNVGSAIMKTLFYIFFVGISEESIYRGFILNKLNLAMKNKILIIICTSVLFSFSHILNMQGVQMIESFIVSIIYCVLRYKFKDKSIIPLIFAHGVFDSLPIWFGILFVW